jgi:hypothetical protein
MPAFNTDGVKKVCDKVIHSIGCVMNRFNLLSIADQVLQFRLAEE